ncbi:hypothetical protein CYMTET_7775 [Cymbomonas tetramitiformis]|uniref:Uncharacterized protein n=1 Tax=Cymbomonas tetramitiformis TaxID=36881 RepID=A0AAE0GUK9_9CHLO|nr:hypothetical protein CYMTET_7775 [Cymbomonas tetramitiformis]
MSQKPLIESHVQCQYDSFHLDSSPETEIEFAVADSDNTVSSSWRTSRNLLVSCVGVVSLISAVISVTSSVHASSVAGEALASSNGEYIFQPALLCNFWYSIHLSPRILLPFCEGGNTSSTSNISTTCLQPNEPKLEPGYVLTPGGPGKHYTDLIDVHGMVRHRWVYPDHPMEKAAVLTPHGTLFMHRHYRPMDIPKEWAGSADKPQQDKPQFIEARDAAGLLTELSWDSKVVRECSYITDSHILHHDAIVMPNGNYLSLALKRMSLSEFAHTVGMSSESEANNGIRYNNSTENVLNNMLTYYNRSSLKQQPGCMFVDGVVELKAVPGQKQCKVVWEWWSTDHVVQEFDKSLANFGSVKDSPQRLHIYYYDELNGAQTLHLNSVDYNPVLDQILVNSMLTAEMFILDHSTTSEEAASHSGGKYGKGGDLLFRWGNDEGFKHFETGRKIFHAHGAKYVPHGQGLPGEGNIMFFDNGHSRASNLTVNFSSWGNEKGRVQPDEQQKAKKVILQAAKKEHPEVDFSRMVYHPNKHSDALGTFDASAAQEIQPVHHNGVYRMTKHSTYYPTDFYWSCDTTPHDCIRFGGVVKLHHGLHLVTCGYTQSGVFPFDS